MLVTVDDFLASREARDAEVSEVSPEDATLALTEAEATLETELGYKVSDDSTVVTVYGAGNDFIYPEHRIRTISSLTYGGGTLGTTDYYVADNGFSLWRGIRGSTRPWYADQAVVVTGEFGWDPGYVPEDEEDEIPGRSPDPQYILAQRYVRILAARTLAATEESNIPEGVTSLTAEGVSLQFSDNDDLLKLVDRIGKLPSRRGNGLFAIHLTRGDIEDTDAIWEQLQRTK